MSDNKLKKCIGFILIRRYPNCRKQIGEFEPLTTGEFFKYPEIWKPVYKDEPKQSEVTESHKVEIIVTKLN